MIRFVNNLNGTTRSVKSNTAFRTLIAHFIRVPTSLIRGKQILLTQRTLHVHEEGATNSGKDTLREWLMKWEFVDVETMNAALIKEGITSMDKMKKYVVDEKAFNKLVSRLDLKFADEMALEEAWKSVRAKDNDKIVFLGDVERKIWNDLNAKYDNLSKEVESLQRRKNELNKSRVESLKILRQNAQKMIKIIEENEKKIGKEIEQKAEEEKNKMMDLLKILTKKRKICAQRKEEFEQIALGKNMEKNANLRKMESLLLEIESDDEKIQMVEDGLFDILPFDEAAFDENIYSLLSAKESKIKKINDENIKFSEKYGNVAGFKVSNDGRTVTVNKNWATVFCENGFNAGIHSWKVKYESDNYYPIIGIMNTLEGAGKGICYMWSIDYIYGNKDDKKLFKRNIGKHWKTGSINSIVTVTLNCDEWILTFFHNNEYVIKIDIESNQTYYPVFVGFDGDTLTIVD